MSKQTVDIGSSYDDPAADQIRDAFDKCNTNFDQLFPIYRNTSTVTITAGEDTLFDGASPQFPGNSLAVGDVIEIEAFGFIGDPDATSPGASITVKLGGVTLLVENAGGSAPSNSNYHFRCLVTVRTTGAVASVVAASSWASNGGVGVLTNVTVETGAVVDTTADCDLEVIGHIDNIDANETIDASLLVVTQR